MGRRFFAILHHTEAILYRTEDLHSLKRHQLPLEKEEVVRGGKVSPVNDPNGAYTEKAKSENLFEDWPNEPEVYLYFAKDHQTTFSFYYPMPSLKDFPLMPDSVRHFQARRLRHAAFLWG